MSDYPEFVEVEGKLYKINTDFRYAIECNRIATDPNIGNYERVLGIICTLFGCEALDNPSHFEKLRKLALKYLSCGKELNEEENEKPDMDYIKDEGYIASSFQYDYKYNPYEMDYCHWYKFYNDLNNLSNSELGNCCILSRIRNLRNLDLSKIKDPKERDKARQIQKKVALKKEKKEATDEQIKSAEEFYKALNI